MFYTMALSTLNKENVLFCKVETTLSLSSSLQGITRILFSSAKGLSYACLDVCIVWTFQTYVASLLLHNAHAYKKMIYGIVKHSVLLNNFKTLHRWEAFLWNDYYSNPI